MSPMSVLVDPSQFPEAVREALHRSLRSRWIEPKFHYDSYKQTRAWLALHEALSPSRRDPLCQHIYTEAMARMAAGDPPTHLISLGCGGGEKEAVLLETLRAKNIPRWYAPVDVSLPLTLVAATRAAEGKTPCHPVVCDLARVQDLPGLFLVAPEIPRVVTLFGVLPNLEAALILPKVAHLLRPGDRLLISANLASSAEYPVAVRGILPQYDNRLTNEWLMLLLLDLGFEREDGRVRWSVEAAPDQSGLLGLVAWYDLERSRRLRVEDQEYLFEPGERIRLFASWRHTPELLASEMRRWRLRVRSQWLAPEEGVFLVEREG